jgi:hypothetical protein
MRLADGTESKVKWRGVFSENNLTEVKNAASSPLFKPLK